MMKSDRSVLRPESQQLDWNSCNSSQKQSLRTMVNFLVEAVDELDRTSAFRTNQVREFIHPFYHNSLCNRTCLLEGERGSGKTSVLKTLYRMTFSEQGRRQCFAESSAAAAQASAEVPSESRLPPIHSQSDDDEELLHDLKKLEKRLIWLDPIDMEVLPGPSNLFAAILTRIEEVLEPPMGKSDYENYPGILCHNSVDSSALIQLRQLMQDVTLAWDGNMPQRGEHLDPDSYAVEVIRAERARISIPERLQKILSSLLVRGKNPMFVLPIDDCDMSPTRCIELLRLLRMLSIPELFTIVLGRLSSTVDVLRLKLTGDMAKVANVRLESGDMRRHKHEEHHRLAIEVLRKLMPPGQRVSLKNMRILESMSYRPSPKAADLGTLISQCKLRTGHDFASIGVSTTNVSLAHFLFAGPLPSQLRITSAGILKAPPRQIADLWQSLNSIPSTPQTDTEQPHSVLPIIVNLYQEAVRSMLDETYITSFLRLFESHEDESGTRWSIGSGAKVQFKIQLENPQILRLSSEVEDCPQRLQISHEIRVDGDWTLAPQIPHGDNVANSTQTISEFMPYATLCNDLIVAASSTKHESLAPSSCDAISTVWTYREQKARFTWPSPTFTTFVQIDAFLEKVRLDVKELRSQPEILGDQFKHQHELVLAWLNRWVEYKGVPVEDRLTSRQSISPLNLSSFLTERLMALISNEYIADPEVILNYLFADKSVRAFFHKNVKAIREERIAMLAKMVNETPNPLATMLLPSAIRHEIAQEFEDKSRALLKSFHLPFPPARKKTLSRREELNRDVQIFIKANKVSNFQDLGNCLQLLENIRSSDIWNGELAEQIFMSDDLNAIISRAHELGIDNYHVIAEGEISPKVTNKDVRLHFTELNRISRRDLYRAGANRSKLSFATDT